MVSPAEGAFPPHAAFTLLNQSRAVFVIAGGDGVLRYVSPSASNLFGFKNGMLARLWRRSCAPAGSEQRRGCTTSRFVRFYAPNARHLAGLRASWLFTCGFGGALTLPRAAQLTCWASPQRTSSTQVRPFRVGMAAACF